MATLSSNSITAYIVRAAQGGCTSNFGNGFLSQCFVLHAMEKVVSSECPLGQEALPGLPLLAPSMAVSSGSACFSLSLSSLCVCTSFSLNGTLKCHSKQTYLLSDPTSGQAAMSERHPILPSFRTVLLGILSQPQTLGPLWLRECHTNRYDSLCWPFQGSCCVPPLEGNKARLLVGTSNCRPLMCIFREK